jgi:hypothetical protein
MKIIKKGIRLLHIKLQQMTGKLLFFALSGQINLMLIFISADKI